MAARRRLKVLIFPTMNKTEAVKATKQQRVDLDAVLQQMKDLKKQVQSSPDEEFEDKGEAIASQQLAIRHVEDAIMRSGMVLKNTGNPNPYPESYNPDSPKVEPTADGIKL